MNNMPEMDNNEKANHNEEESRNAVEIQQEFFINLPDCDWVKYTIRDRSSLMQNIAFVLYGSPSIEGDLTHENEKLPTLKGYTSRQAETVKNIYEKICDQSKYTQNGEDIMMSVILVVCARPPPTKFFKITPNDAWVDLHLKKNVEMWYTAVFCLRKCVPLTEGARACKVYIDGFGRVYHTWESYLYENTEPKCVLIVPQDGQYSGIPLEGKDEFMVKLTVCPSPSLGLKARVLSTTDTASTVASLGALGVIGVSLLTPVGPAVVLGATVATVATGLYGVVRSSLHLHDRRIHEQTVSPTDPEARGCWINIAASTVGVTSCAASNLLARSAAAGTNMSRAGQILTTSVNVLRHANILTGGVGVFHSLWHIIEKFHKYNEKPTSLELFQLTSSLLFFSSAVVSNKTAQAIIEDAQAKTINDYRATLRSNRHRKILDKISAEARRAQGLVQGNAEVIQGIKNVANKDQFFADVLRINKQVNQHKLRISLTADGQINLNSRYKYHPSELSAMGTEGRAQLFSSIDPSKVAGSNVPTRLAPNAVYAGKYGHGDDEAHDVMVGIHPGEVIRIGQLLLRLTTSGNHQIATTLEHLSQETYENMINVVINLISKMAPVELRELKLLSPDEDIIAQCVKFFYNYLRHKRPLGEVSDEDSNLVAALKEFFQDGILRRERILLLKDDFTEWLKVNLNNLHEKYPGMVICPTCEGVRYA